MARRSRDLFTSRLKYPSWQNLDERVAAMAYGEKARLIAEADEAY